MQAMLAQCHVTNFRILHPRNIIETAKATEFKFGHGLAMSSTDLQMTNCPLSRHGEGHVTNFRISHPLKYL